MTQRSWLQIGLVAALALSVLANFFLAGYLARHHRAGIGGGTVAEALVRAYPEDVRKEFRKLLRENRSRTFAAVRALLQARRALADAAGATPYIQADVEKAMAGVRASTEALQAMMQRLLLEALRNTRQAV
ncbi:MAG: periplasmic heavy metal sensor [Hyphomicrobiales bacterium]|nr:periplasmic heavy metal sensor [Hyphomicrobiales bacterium]